MKETFTKFVQKFIMSLFVVVLGAGTIHAQWIFEITTPQSVAGQYDYGLANFGSYYDEEGELALAFDGTDDPTLGCEPLVTDMTGQIAILDRGACNFSLKAYHAQEAGAAALIICNNEPGLLNMAPGDFGDLVSIPVILLEMSDCISIKAAIEEDESVIGEFYYPGFTPEKVLWGLEPGQGDFDGGLNEWTTEGLSAPEHVWEHRPDAQSRGGCGQFRIASPTFFNGAMVFDADFYITGGPEDDGGQGCVGPELDIHGELISPVIDCSDFDAVAVEFWQFNLGITQNPTPGSTRERTYMQFSTDGGLSWGDRVPITTNNFQSSSGSSITNPERVVIIVPEAANEPEFRMKFIHDGSHYVWTVDDVRLIEPPQNDLAMQSIFYPLRSFATPADYISADTFGFFCFVSNEGFTDQENVEVSVQVYNTDTGEILHEEIVQRSLISRGQLDTIQFTQNFSMPGIVGNYAIRYHAETVGVDDEIPEDNTIERRFVVTDDIFAKEDPAVTSFGGGVTNSEDNWYWGNVYYIPDGLGGTPVFNGVELSFVPTAGEFSGENPAVHLLEYVPAGPDISISDLNANSDLPPQFHTLFEPVAIGIIDSVLLNEAGPGGILRMDVSQFLDPNFVSIEGDYIELNQDKLYAVVLQMEGDALRLPASSSILYNTAVGILYVDNANGVKQYYNGYTSLGGPVARMITSVFVSTEDIAPFTPKSVQIYPNPTSNDLYLNFDNEQPTDVRLELFDMQGRLLMHRNYENVGNEVIQSDVRTYQSGNYIIRIKTDRGVQSQPVIIAR